MNIISRTILGGLLYHLVPVSAEEPDPLITQAPELALRDDSQLVGYFSTHGSYQPLSCEKGVPELSTYTVGPTQVLLSCVPTESPTEPFPTGCNGHALMYPTKSIICTAPLNCQTNYAVHSSGAEATATWYYCGSVTGVLTLVRSTETPSPTPAPSSSSSKAWIAGPVIGGVVGLALIGAGIWFFMARKKKKAKAAGGPDAPLTGGGTSISGQTETAGTEKFVSPPQSTASPYSVGYQQYGQYPPSGTTHPSEMSPEPYWNGGPQEMEAHQWHQTREGAAELQAGESPARELPDSSRAA